MRPAGLAMELEHRDELGLVLDLGVLGGDPLRDDRRVLVDADDRVRALELAEELVIANLVDPDAAGFVLGGDFGLFDEAVDEVRFDLAVFGDEDVECFLGGG